MNDTTFYINVRTQYGVETVDEFSLSDYVKEHKTAKGFYKYVMLMVREYNMSMSGHYKSQRSTNDWRNNS